MMPVNLITRSEAIAILMIPKFDESLATDRPLSCILKIRNTSTTFVCILFYSKIGEKCLLRNIF